MSEKEKRPYCKPEIERVRLVPEEAVLGGCKTETAGGGIGLNTSGSCVATGCVSSDVWS
jgi:hypothetical protein